MSGDEMKVKSTLSITLTVTCPHCDHFFDLVEDTDLNEEGELLNEILVCSGSWSDAHENFERTAICPECSVEIDIAGVDW